MFANFLIAPLFIASSIVAAPTFVRRDVSLSDWSSQNLEVGGLYLGPETELSRRCLIVILDVQDALQVS
jgi:hypothetical protein